MESNDRVAVKQELTHSNPCGTPLWRRSRNLVIAGLGAAFILYLVLAVASRWQNLIELQIDRVQGTAEQGPVEDYIAFYTAGRLVLDGRGESVYDLDVIAEREHEMFGRDVGGTGRLGFFNPPFVAVIFAPLALLPPNLESPLLLILNGVLVLAAGVILQRLLKLRGLLPSTALWLTILSLYSVYWTLVHGQLSMFILLGFLGFFGLQREGKPRLSGLALALLLIKPQMAVVPVLVLLYKRRWTELTAFGTVALGLVAVSVAISGPSILWEYPKFALNASEWERTFAWQVQRMYGLNGLLATVIDKHSTIHFVLTGVASVATIALAVSAFRGPWKPASTAFPLGVAGMVAASVLINPHIWMQDMVLVGLVAALGLINWRERERTAGVWVSIAVLVWTTQWISFRVEDLYGVNLQTPLLIATFAYLLWEIRELMVSADSTRSAQSDPVANVAA
jgi:Glycosyltransferase family 87